MPQQAELLFTFAYALGGPNGGEVRTLGFFAALLALLAQMAGRFAPAVLVAASPVVMIDGTSAYNDVMLAFYALCLTVLCSWTRQDAAVFSPAPHTP